MRRSPEFQRRIDDAIEDGWQIEEESPGRVVLRKPDYGDLAVHILLFVFTAGLGNLIYRESRQSASGSSENRRFS